MIGPSIEVEEVASDPHRHLVIRGEIDIKTAPALDDAIGETSQPVLLLEMVDVSFIDSTGLRVLAVARERFSDAGRKLVVAAPDDSAVVRTMRLAGLASDFHLIGRADELTGVE